MNACTSIAMKMGIPIPMNMNMNMNTPMGIPTMKNIHIIIAVCMI